MTTELDLLESPAARAQHLDRVDVLDNVREIVQLPADAAVSFGIAADIFGVPHNTVLVTFERNMGEYVNAHAIDFSDNVSSKPGGRKASRGLNRRGLLLLAMGLRDSEVAKNVRRMLLGTFEYAEQAHKATTIEIDYVKLAEAVRAVIAEEISRQMPGSEPLRLSVSTSGNPDTPWPSRHLQVGAMQAAEFLSALTGRPPMSGATFNTFAENQGLRPTVLFPDRDPWKTWKESDVRWLAKECF